MATFAQLRETLGSRHRAVLATIVPLLILVGFWTVAVVFAGKETIGSGAEKVLIVSAICALGPFAGQAMQHLPLIGGFTVAALVWAAWIAAVVWTPVGRVHWGLHLIASPLWCEIGFYCFGVGGLAAT